MKNVILFCLLAISAFTSACGNTRFSNESNPTRSEDVQSTSSGLVLTVTNSLPEQQMENNRVRPHLNAYFCSPIPSEGRIPPSSERCIFLPGVIRNGTTETFVVTRDQVAAIHRAGNGFGAFEFTDDQQLTSSPWHCYTPNNRVALNSNFDIRQAWTVEVNQRFQMSYGCLVSQTH